MKLWSIVGMVMLFLVMLSSSALAQTGHMTLLAVSEQNGVHIGGTADLDLEIRPGSGRVFLETYPFTEVDTQMSTRFANEIACDYLDRSCDEHDFFYTIASGSSIVAGPSAGAAMTALTIALLNGDEVNQQVAITGTINSGGIVGPVGGIHPKIQAAKQKDITTVLIPLGFSALENNTQNQTPQELGESLGMQVIQVGTIDEILHHMLGYPLPVRKEVAINPDYQETMKGLAEELCERSDVLKELVNNVSTRAKNLTAQAQAAAEFGQYYASASYCYGANVDHVQSVIEQENFTTQKKSEYMANLQNKIHLFQRKAENFSISTITDLETYMIVKERLAEAQDHLDAERNTTNMTVFSSANLAFATERLHSAESWSSFLGSEAKQYDIDSNALSQSCVRKIGEVDQRIKYMEQFAFLPITHIKEDLQDAQQEFDKGNYELCLFKASKTKGAIGVVLSVLGVSQESFQDLLDTKLSIVSEELAEQDAFPILGYSYYEYAQSLRDQDIISALLYAEYALEMGNLDMYFGQERIEPRAVRIDKKKLNIFLLGIFFGVVSGLLIGRLHFKPRKRSNSKRKR